MPDHLENTMLSEDVLYERLDYYLLTFGSERSLLCVSELDGFLTALGCAAQEMEPDLWLRAIWGADEDQPVWDSSEQEDEFLSLVLMMYMDTMNALIQADLSPVYLEQNIDGECQIIVEEWCVGFMRGARLLRLGVGGSNRDFYDEVLAPIRLFGTEAGWQKMDNMMEEEVTFWRETIEPSVVRLAQFHHPEIHLSLSQSFPGIVH